MAPVSSVEPRTDEDADIRICRTIATHLRDFPLLPADGRDYEKVNSFRDVHSGIALPALHCGFKGCGWTCQTAPTFHWQHEMSLSCHLTAEHRYTEMSSVPATAWDLKMAKQRKQAETSEAVENEGEADTAKKWVTLDAFAYYQAAVQLKEQEHIPIIGPSVDRRMLRMMTKLLNSDTVQGLILPRLRHRADSCEMLVRYCRH